MFPILIPEKTPSGIHRADYAGKEVEVEVVVLLVVVSKVEEEQERELNLRRNADWCMHRVTHTHEAPDSEETCTLQLDSRDSQTSTMLRN